MTSLAFRVGHYEEAVALVERYHYSGRAPHAPQVIGSFHAEGGLFGDYGPMLGACFLSIPSAPWSEDILELSRLVRTDVPIPLVPLISLTVREAKARGFDLIVSFADWKRNHHGGIYQAASWAYAGFRAAKVDGFIIDGTFKPKRSCNSTWGTSSERKLREMFPAKRIEPHLDHGKHLYWKALGSRGRAKAERLGLKSLPYPKPAMLEAAE